MDISDFRNETTRYIQTLSGILHIEPKTILENIVVYHMASKQAQLDLYDNAEYPEFEKVKNKVLTGKRLFYSLLNYFKKSLDRLHEKPKPLEDKLYYYKQRYPDMTEEQLKKKAIETLCTLYKSSHDPNERSTLDDGGALELVKKEYPHLFE